MSRRKKGPLSFRLLCALGLMVEMMATAMTEATLGVDVSPFSGTVGGPPRTGQFFWQLTHKLLLLGLL